MKKVLVCALSAIVLTAGVSSCAKTTKGKISEDWNITSIATNSSSTSGGTTSTSSSTTTIAGNAYTKATTGTNGQTSTVSGTVTKYNFIIKKDGTYEKNSDYQFVYSMSGTDHTMHVVETEKGTWSFVGTNKTDEFKKNERVVFNTTSFTSNNSDSYLFGGSTVTNTSLDTYSFLVGESSTIFTVTESTGKKLVLSSEENSSNSSSVNNGSTSTDSDSGKTTITLEKP